MDNEDFRILLGLLWEYLLISPHILQWGNFSLQEMFRNSMFETCAPPFVVIHTILSNSYGSLWITVQWDCTDAPDHGTSPNKLLSHSVSCPTSFRVINLDSMVDLPMQVCFADFHYIDSLPNKNMYPLVELTSSLFVTQFSSQYPSNGTKIIKMQTMVHCTLKIH